MHQSPAPQGDPGTIPSGCMGLFLSWGPPGTFTGCWGCSQLTGCPGALGGGRDTLSPCRKCPCPESPGGCAVPWPHCSQHLRQGETPVAPGRMCGARLAQGLGDPGGTGPRTGGPLVPHPRSQLLSRGRADLSVQVPPALHGASFPSWHVPGPRQLAVTQPLILVQKTTPCTALQRMAHSAKPALHRGARLHPAAQLPWGSLGWVRGCEGQDKSPGVQIGHLNLPTRLSHPTALRYQVNPAWQ